MIDYLKELWKAADAVPLWKLALTVFGTGALINAGIKAIHRYTNVEDSKEDYSNKSVQEEIKEPEGDEEYYKLRSISQAVSTGEGSMIKGIIKEYHILPYGFSGVISDSYIDACFHMGNNYINTEEEGGLVPILLKDSKENEKEMKMQGCFDKEIGTFVVESLEHRYNHINYYIC